MPNTLTSEYLTKSIYKPGILKGKVAFVTGGAGSICRVQTEALVLLGADAVILGRSVDKTVSVAKEIAQLRPGARVLGLGGVDVRDVQALKKAADDTVKQLGRIDFVIAGAAGNFLSSFANLSARAFRTVIEIDLLGTFNTAKATFEALRETRGAFLFVTATLQYKGLPMQVHPSAAKAGVDSLIQSLAVELGPFGIRVNGIAPGAISGTEGIDRLLPEDMRERAKQQVPLQRLGTTRDIADATVFLFSDAASYVTGDILIVDGAQWHVGGPEASFYPEIIVASNGGDNKL